MGCSAVGDGMFQGTAGKQCCRQPGIPSWVARVHRGASGARAFSLASAPQAFVLGFWPLCLVCGITHPPRKAAGGKLRRTAGGLHLFGGELR